MSMTNERLQRLHQVVATPSRDKLRGVFKRLAFALILTGLCGLLLTGCQDFWDTTADLIRIDGGDAEAQDQTETRVITYVINTDGFEIILDNESDTTPSHRIIDSATEITMQSEGSLVRGNGESNIALEVSDIIILRFNGANGSATLIRND